MPGSKGRLHVLCFLAIILLLPIVAHSDQLPPGFYLAGNGGADRCSTRDCMCRVRPGPRPTNLPTLEETNRRFSAYFPTAEHDLSQYQLSQLRSFLSSMGALSASSATVMAYTDGCGSTSYNIGLARRRLSTAIEVVEFNIRSTLVHPEAPPECPLQSARRIDIIVHTERALTTAIDRVPADVYLLDGSGSMWPSWRRWTDVVNASYKPGARIYVSKVSGCRQNQSLNSIEPGGGTEIWYSYYSIIDTMERGETLAIVSDFDSDIPLRDWERRLLADKVREQGINVITLRPGR